MGYIETALVKKPHQKQHWEDKHILDISKCLDPITGPLYFLKNFFHIQHPTQGQLLFDPFDYQIELINSYINHRFSINLLSRQLGKCLTYDITIINKSNNTKIQIGDLLWEELTIRQKVVTKLEDWLVRLAK